MSEVKFSPKQKEVLKLLSDGRRHSTAELHEIFKPSSEASVRVAISTLRKKLQPMGEDIVCVFSYRKYYYQHVRLVGNPYG